MPDESQELVSLVTRGLANIQEKHAHLSESMVGFKFQLEQLNKTLARFEDDLAKAATERLTLRVEQLEEFKRESERKQDDNRKWFKGMLASIILLLIGFLFNFVKINFGLR